MKLKTFLISLILWNLLKKFQCKVLMTKVTCFNIGNEQYFNIDNCELIKNSNNLSVLNLYLHYLNKSVTTVHLQTVLRKRINKRLAPAVFNSTFDFCFLFSNRNKNRAFAALYELIEPFINLQDGCPYEHDVYVKEFDPNLKANFFLKYIPLPRGSFIFDSDWIFGPNARLKVKVDFDHLKN